MWRPTATAVTRKEELVQRGEGASAGAPVVLKVDRDGNLTELLVQPVLDKEGSYKLGLWVRDDTQGIGTLTYMDENGRYGALGHGISDVDTGTLLNLSGGTSLPYGHPLRGQRPQGNTGGNDRRHPLSVL